MPKLTLQQAPTFKARVPIPVAGGRPVPVEFTFRNRTREEFDAWSTALPGRRTEEVLLDMAVGWELEDAFDAENVGRLLSNYIGAFSAVFDVYVSELTKVKEKN